MEPSMSRKSDLKDRIKRRLGYPMIKLEITDDQIYDNIHYSRVKFIRWAAGHATQDVFFTMMLSAGQWLYDMPSGTVEVISYDASVGQAGGINTLFTVENFLYSQGMFGILNPTTNEGFTLIGYHMARDFLETLERYNPDSFNFKYHRTTNQLEIQPPPPSGYVITVGENTYNSPGFILIHAVMIDGSTLGTWEGYDGVDDWLYNSQWVEDFSIARTKYTLGLIRRKFANFTALGNQGTAMDGDSLVQEAKEEMDNLIVSLRDQESYKGLGILVG
jgi:hypothetical protein